MIRSATYYSATITIFFYCKYFTSSFMQNPMFKLTRIESETYLFFNERRYAILFFFALSLSGKGRVYWIDMSIFIAKRLRTNQFQNKWEYMFARSINIVFRNWSKSEISNIYLHLQRIVQRIIFSQRSVVKTLHLRKMQMI